jgi:acyl-CoA thioesterase II
MASKNSLKDIFVALNDFRGIDDNTLRWNGPHLGGPFFLKRLFGGTTIALSYLALKKIVPEITVEKMQLNLFRPGDADGPLDFSLVPSGSRTLFILTVLQKDKLIALARFRVIPSKEYLIKSKIKPWSQPTKPVLHYPILSNMRDMAPHPSVASISDRRFNNEWLFNLRPLDWNHFYGVDLSRKPIQTFLTLNKQAIGSNLDTLDPVAVLLMAADFTVFQSAKNVHKLANRSNECIAGSTMNFVAWFHEIDGFQVFDDFLVENHLDSLGHSCAYLPGRIFDTKGRCLMTYSQESFISSNIFTDARL